MFGIHDFGLFIVSGLLLNIAPGPDIAYIAGRSVQLGWRGGVTAALAFACCSLCCLMEPVMSSRLRSSMTMRAVSRSRSAATGRHRVRRQALPD